MPASPAPTEGILGTTYRASTIGAFSLIVIAAFEALAVTTVMPTISRELDGLTLYAPVSYTQLTLPTKRIV